MIHLPLLHVYACDSSWLVFGEGGGTAVALKEPRHCPLAVFSSMS